MAYWFDNDVENFWHLMQIINKFHGSLNLLERMFYATWGEGDEASDEELTRIYLKAFPARMKQTY